MCVSETPHQRNNVNNDYVEAKAKSANLFSLIRQQCKSKVFCFCFLLHQYQQQQYKILLHAAVGDIEQDNNDV